MRCWPASSLTPEPGKHIGELIPGTLPEEAKAEEAAPAPAPASSSQAVVLAAPEPYVKPHLGEILSLHDFETVARETMTRRGWNYYSSGADDEITMVGGVGGPS